MSTACSLLLFRPPCSINWALITAPPTINFYQPLISRLLTLFGCVPSGSSTGLVSSASHSTSVRILPIFSWYHNLWRTFNKSEMSPQFTPRWLHASIYLLFHVLWKGALSPSRFLLHLHPTLPTHSFDGFLSSALSVIEQIHTPSKYRLVLIWSKLFAFYLPIPYHSIFLLVWTPTIISPCICQLWY